MSTKEKFSGILAVVLLVTIAYFSMTTKTEVVKEVVIDTYEVVVNDTITVTYVDTLWKYHTWEDDIIKNEDNLIVSMSFLFSIADDNEVANQIRNNLPFGDVFNYWREELGACGMFQWNDDLYLTLYKEESITDCEVYDQQ